MTTTTTSRQTVAAKQRNSNLKVRSVVIESRKALVVKIDWTTAPVVKTTIRKAFKLSVLAMDTKNWTVIQRGMMSLKEGQVIHFVASDDHPGYYYVTIVGESCTCVAGLYKQSCHHQAEAQARVQAQPESREAVIAEMHAGMAAIGQRLQAKLLSLPQLEEAA